MAIFQKKIVSKRPIGNMSVKGEVLLKHGTLFDINVNCTGSAPWLFCWQIMQKVRHSHPTSYPLGNLTPENLCFAGLQHQWERDMSAAAAPEDGVRVPHPVVLPAVRHLQRPRRN